MQEEHQRIVGGAIAHVVWRLTEVSEWVMKGKTVSIAFFNLLSLKVDARN